MRGNAKLSNCCFAAICIHLRNTGLEFRLSIITLPILATTAWMTKRASNLYPLVSLASPAYILQVIGIHQKVPILLPCE